MIKILKIFTCLFLLTYSLYGCGKTPCIRSVLSFNLIGYNDTEVDTLILRTYSKGSGFTNLKDTAFCQVSYTKSNDTLRVSFIKGAFYINSLSDYQIYFPGVGKQYSLTEINEEVTELTCYMSCPKPGECSIVSLKANGQFMPIRRNEFFAKK